jgi:hypothetical protein
VDRWLFGSIRPLGLSIGYRGEMWLDLLREVNRE